MFVSMGDSETVVTQTTSVMAYTSTEYASTDNYNENAASDAVTSDAGVVGNVPSKISAGSGDMEVLTDVMVTDNTSELTLRLLVMQEQQLEILKQDLYKLKNMVKFIEEVANGSIDVFKTKVDIIRALKEKVIEPLPKKNKVEELVAGATGDNSEGSGDAERFDYLLKMTIRSFTAEGHEKICKEIDQLEKEIAKLENKTPEDLWLMDLEALEKELDVQDERDDDVDREAEAAWLAYMESSTEFVKQTQK